VKGIPEWAVSIGLVENGEAVAGGIFNPVRNELMLGGLGAGVSLNGVPVSMSKSESLQGARVVASRSEIRRGEWDVFAASGMEVVPTGSVAYKLGLVACGLADLTWTLTPKNEWDVAAGVALVRAGGGEAWLPNGERPCFNRARTRLPGLIVAPAQLVEPLKGLLAKLREEG
jgi:myo-inositol-1(or 4)-monophosphatase